ncbi:MAG: 50S ribosomal protein L10 [Patescibacteria group bacterium]|nr:50S ribosomal protein L10 [Patescibacteria group bacterium]
MDKITQKVSKNRVKKQEAVAEISAKVAKSKAMVFTNYTGLTHKQLEAFKREIKKANAEFAVTKNTLLKRALTDANLETGDTKNFDLPTGAMFLYGDVVMPLKALAQMVKDLEKPQIKFGLLEGKLMTDKEVLKLSTLPSREVLIGQLMGMMNAPLQGLHRALSWNLQKFVMTLAAIEKKKQA